MKRVVQFSGGVGSWLAARRVADKFGSQDMILLFANVKMEDEDLYRFLPEAAANIGAPLVVLEDGRTPWQVFNDERYIGNSRVDPCSRKLKRELCDRWMKNNCVKAETVRYVGIDWTEEHRLIAIRERLAGWQIEAPLCEPPLLSKEETLQACRDAGMRPPRLYEMGFPHNNCGGFCVKAGQANFELLLRKLPERYAAHEEQERQLIKKLGKNVSIMKDRRGGKSRPMTMEAFRKRVQGGFEWDCHEWGGCGCAID